MFVGARRVRLESRVLTGLVLALASWMLLPVLRSGYLADDIPNSQRTAWLSELNESVWSFTVRLTRQWMTNEGRFFPVSVFENTLLFDFVHSRLVYKSMQIVSVVVVILLLMSFIQRVADENRGFAILCSLCVVGTIQVRAWYDPVISFGLLLPSACGKVLAALILVCVGIRARRQLVPWLAFIGAGILWFAALLQYEVVLLLGWIPFGIAFINHQSSIRRRVASVMCIGVPSLVAVVISRIVRSGVVPSPAYQTNLRLPDVVRALKFQALGALPFATANPGIDGRPGPLDSLRALSVVGWAMIIVTVCIVVYVVPRMTPLRAGVRLMLAAVGLSFWVLPSIPTSLSVRWQGELGPGKAYLPVFMGYLGVGLILAVMFEFAVATLRQTKCGKWAGGASAAAVSVALVCCIAFNHAGVNHVVNMYSGFRTDRDLFEQAVHNGLFDSVRPGQLIVSPVADPNTWVNPVYLRWLGGPAKAVFVKPEETGSCNDERPEWCSEGQYFVMVQAGDGNNSALFLVETEALPNVPLAWAHVRSVIGFGWGTAVDRCRPEIQPDKRGQVRTCSRNSDLREFLKIPE